MAAPNLISLTGRTPGRLGLTSSAYPAMDQIIAPVTSGHAIQVLSLIACNATPGTAARMYVSLTQGAADPRWLAYEEAVPARKHVSVLPAGGLILLEDDILAIAAKVADSVHFTISYLDLTDL